MHVNHRDKSLDKNVINELHHYTNTVISRFGPLKKPIRGLRN